MRLCDKKVYCISPEVFFYLFPARSGFFRASSGEIAMKNHFVGLTASVLYFADFNVIITALPFRLNIKSNEIMVDSLLIKASFSGKK
jgi:hypothetical protein